MTHVVCTFDRPLASNLYNYLSLRLALQQPSPGKTFHPVRTSGWPLEAPDKGIGKKHNMARLVRQLLPLGKKTTHLSPSYIHSCEGLD